MSSLVTCPYCEAQIEVPTPLIDQESGLHAVCSSCHKPLVVYPSHTLLQLHEDRSIKAVAVEVRKYAEGVLLEVMESPYSRHQELRVPEGKSMIGKQNPDSSTEIQILTDDLDLMRNHAELWYKKDGTLMIRDRAERGTTFVNGDKLGKGDWKRLNPGDVLVLGSTSLIAHLPDEGDDFPFFD